MVYSALSKVVNLARLNKHGWLPWVLPFPTVLRLRPKTPKDTARSSCAMSASGDTGPASGSNRRYGIPSPRFAAVNTARRTTFAAMPQSISRRTVRWPRRYGFSSSIISADAQPRTGIDTPGTARACSCPSRRNAWSCASTRRIGYTLRMDQTPVGSVEGAGLVRDK
jgi:hypothetical protein